MRIRLPIAATLAAVMAVSSLGLNSASAAPAARLPAAQQNAGNQGDVIQVAAKKKRYHRNNAAAAAAFAGIAGAMIGAAVADSQRDRYYGDGYYYDGGRRYYRGRTHYRGGYVNQPLRYNRNGAGPYGSGLESPHPQNYGTGPHPPIQNWGQDR